MLIRRPFHVSSLVCHLLAIFWFGVMAGFFGTYSANVSLATASFDGALYATVQSALNRNVRHALFYAFFFLPPAWCVAALIAGWRHWKAWGILLAASALLYLLGIIFFTREVNLPLNAYTESWSPGDLPADWSQTRERWNFANAWRSLASSACFVLALLSLTLRARFEH